jgi:hypothetical protein
MKILWSVTVAAAALAMTGCGDDVPAVCETKEQVLATVDEIRNDDLIADGLSGLESQFDELVSEIGELRGAVSDEVAPDVDAVRTAVDDARSAVSAAGTPQEKLTALQDGWANVQDAVSSLRSPLPECD